MAQRPSHRKLQCPARRGGIRGGDRNRVQDLEPASDSSWIGTAQHRAYAVARDSRGLAAVHRNQLVRGLNARFIRHAAQYELKPVAPRLTPILGADAL